VAALLARLYDRRQQDRIAGGIGTSADGEAELILMEATGSVEVRK